jgi:histidyl-tRNA synthetase
MSLSTQPYKGARDFYPKDKRVQKYMFGVMRKVAESFGYQEYDAPIIELFDVYAAKTGEEIVNEQLYSFEDRGGRKVAIRPEMTPSVSRMVAARRQELAYPLRLYSIPNLWRYERPQRGRLREHWQLNVDLFGVAGIEADHEIIAVSDAIMQAYGAKRDMYTIRINSRKLVDYLLGDYLKLGPEQIHAVVKLMDRKLKMEPSEFSQQAVEILGDEQSRKLINVLDCKNLNELPEELRGHKSATKLKQLFRLLNESGIDDAIFDLGVMRGFDYYTDIVFEVFDNHPDNNRSMFGGGRYDGLVGLFGVEPIPTVGFGMGDVTLQNFLESNNLLPKLEPETDAVVILIGDVYHQAQNILSNLRKEGIRLAVDTSGRKLDSQIKSAAKSGTSCVLFIGEKELSQNSYKLKELASGEEKDLSFEQVVDTLSRR